MNTFRKAVIYGALATLGILAAETASAYYDANYHVYRIYVLDDGTVVY